MHNVCNLCYLEIWYTNYKGPKEKTKIEIQKLSAAPETMRKLNIDNTFPSMDLTLNICQFILVFHKALFLDHCYFLFTSTI